METEKQETTTSLLFRNLIFTILQPGLVTGVIPYYLLGDEVNVLQVPWRIQDYAGLIIFLAGLLILFRCIIQFALEGRGTLSPVDPTKRLVIRGLYQYSRNPMYVGVMMILIGEAMLTSSFSMWIYLSIVFVGFNLFIMLHEEPRLDKDFGQEYVHYRQKVRRWI